MAKPKQLTPKMLHFARLVASGKSQADAYREAYDPSESTTAKSVHTLASRLMSRVDIRSRVDGLIKARDMAVATSAVSAKARILERLTEAMDDNDFGVNRIRAIEVMARICGLLNNNVTVESKAPTSPEAVALTLAAKLESLGIDSAPPEADEGVRPPKGRLN